MATKQQNQNEFQMSENITMIVNKDDYGEMYISDFEDTFILNSFTAKDLIDYFAYEENINLSEEILDLLMDMDIDLGTH